MRQNARLAAGLAIALLASAARAQPDQAAHPCPPTDFAKGLCDGIEASAKPGAAGGKLLVAPGAPGLKPTDAAGFTISHLDMDAGGEATDWSKARSQDAGPAVGGVPSIRPMGRPAVVVPILSF